MRIGLPARPASASQRSARRRNRAIFSRVTASSPEPNPDPLRVFTSQTTTVAPSKATMSISPTSQRQFRARMTNPSRCRYRTATCSPYCPILSLTRTGLTSGTERVAAGRGGQGRWRRMWTPHVSALSCGQPGRTSRAATSSVGCWTPRGVVPHHEAYMGGVAGNRVVNMIISPEWGRSGLGDLEVALGQFFHVDVAEGHHFDVLHEPRRAVHVPHPRVAHRHLEVDVSAFTADLEVDVGGQVETPLGLDAVGEQPDDVAVLAIERQLHLGFVLLEIFCTHVSRSPLGPSSSTDTTRETFAYDRR